MKRKKTLKKTKYLFGGSHEDPLSGYLDIQRKRLGESPGRIESPGTALADNSIRQARALQEAADDPFTQGLDIFGNLALQIGTSKMQKGMANGEGISESGFNWGNLLSQGIGAAGTLSQMGASGGEFEGEVELEGGEVIETPNGEMAELTGPSHESGGIDMLLPEGTEVFSKRLKGPDGKTFAERKKSRERKLSRLNSLLEKDPMDYLLKKTLEDTQVGFEAQEKEDLAKMEFARELFNSVQMATGGVYDGMQTGGVSGPGDGEENTLPNLSERNPENRKAWKERYGADTQYFVDYLDKVDVTTGQTMRELVQQAAEKHGVDPNLIYNTAVSEGLDKYNYFAEGEELDKYEKETLIPSINERWEEHGIGISAPEYLGLDTIGNVKDRLVKKGYIDPKEYKNKTSENIFLNEKGEKVMSASYKDLGYALDNMTAFLKDSNDMLGDYMKENNIEVSDLGKKFFQNVAYNAGMGNAQKMLKSYNKKGYLEDDNYIYERPDDSWKQIHKNSLKRVSAMVGLDEQNLLKFSEPVKRRKLKSLKTTTKGLAPVGETMAMGGRTGKKMQYGTRVNNGIFFTGGKNPAIDYEAIDSYFSDLPITDDASAYGAGQLPDGPKSSSNFLGTLLGGLLGDTGEGGMPTLGDIVGLAGDATSTFGPMDNTLTARAGDTPNINPYRDFGKDALNKMDQAKGYTAGQRDQALSDIELARSGATRQARNSARGVNTLRALDLATNMGAQRSKSQVYNEFTKLMQNIFAQEAGLENQQDQVVMQGEAQRDLADRQDRDNFYTQLAKDISTKGAGLRKIGSDLNQIKSRNVTGEVLNQMYKNFGVNTMTGEIKSVAEQDLADNSEKYTQYEITPSNFNSYIKNISSNVWSWKDGKLVVTESGEEVNPQDIK